MSVRMKGNFLKFCQHGELAFLFFFLQQEAPCEQRLSSSCFSAGSATPHYQVHSGRVCQEASGGDWRWELGRWEGYKLACTGHCARKGEEDSCCRTPILPLHQPGDTSLPVPPPSHLSHALCPAWPPCPSVLSSSTITGQIPSVFPAMSS